MSRTRLTRIFLIIMLSLSYMLSISSCTADKPKMGMEDELNQLIKTIDKKQDTPLKLVGFEEKLKGYFFEIVEFDVIEESVKSLSPGEAVTTIVLTKLSEKNGMEILKMMKQSKDLTKIAVKTGIVMENIIDEIKTFRTMSGCA